MKPSHKTKPEAYIEQQKLISTPKFILFFILSFGLYEFWWTFKQWRFFIQKNKLTIRPALRSALSLLFTYSLFKHIQEFSDSTSNPQKISLRFYAFGYITIYLLTLPKSYFLLSLLRIIFLIPAFKTINYAKRHSTNVEVIELTKFTAPQKILVVVGSLIWLLIILGNILK